MKKGFTLLELLAAIVILSLLMLMLIPNLIDYYNDSLAENMVTQESNVRDAAKLFVQDYCVNPITDQYYNNCPVRYKDNKYVCLSDIQTAILTDVPYIKDVKYKDTSCKGVVVFTAASTGVYSEANTYLVCEDLYTTEGTDTILYADCFN